MDYEELDAVRYALHCYREKMSDIKEDTREYYDVEMIVKVNTRLLASDDKDACVFAEECLGEDIHMDFKVLDANARKFDVRDSQRSGMVRLPPSSRLGVASRLYRYCCMGHPRSWIPGIYVIQDLWMDKAQYVEQETLQMRQYRKGFFRYSGYKDQLVRCPCCGSEASVWINHITSCVMCDVCHIQTD